MKQRFFVILVMAALGLSFADTSLLALEDSPAQKKEEEKKEEAKEPEVV